MVSIRLALKIHKEARGSSGTASVEEGSDYYKRLLDCITDYGADCLINGLLEITIGIKFQLSSL
jgi:hypothetical protein